MGEPMPGWRSVTFGEVVRLNKDKSKDPEADGLERYVGLEHLEPGDSRIRSWGAVVDGTTFTNRFTSGQVLFGKRRAYQRKVAVADFDGVCSGDIYVLEPNDPTILAPALLPFICQTDAFFEHAVGTSAGSLSPRTNWSSLAKYRFELPPRVEQDRLYGALQRLDSAIDSLRDVVDAASRLVRSSLVDQFRPDRGTQDSFPTHWRTVRVEAAGDVQLGQQRHPKYKTGSNVRPYLRVANVLDGYIDWSDVLEMHFPEKDLAKFELQPGDILLNEGQSTELVGRSAIYRGEHPGCCVQKTLVRFRCGPELIPDFAQSYFQHCLYTGQFARIAVQTTSIAHLTAARFKKMLVPVPPLPEQRAVVERFEEQRSAVDAAQQRLEGLLDLRRCALSEWLTA